MLLNGIDSSLGLLKMKDFDISSTFTIPLIQLKIEEDTSELLSYTKYVENSYQDPSGLGKTDNRVLEKFPKTKKIFLDLFNNIANYELGVSNKFTITTSWMTKTAKGERSQIHNHKNCYFSAVYYFDNEYEKNAGAIEFFNPLEDHSSYTLNYHEINPFTAGTIAITPEPKKVLFFPSFLKHAIMTHQGEKIRKSLAFNYVPIDNYGFEDSTYNQSWIPS